MARDAMEMVKYHLSKIERADARQPNQRNELP